MNHARNRAPHGLHRRILTTVVLTVLTVLGTSLGAPYFGESMTLVQPDGTSVEVVVWGDEFHQHVESPDGYTLAYDPQTLWITYAEKLPGSDDLSPGPVIYRGPLDSKVTTTTATGLKTRDTLSQRRVTKGLHDSRAHIGQQVRQRQLELWGGTTPPWIEAAPAEDGSGPSVGSVVWKPTPFGEGDITGLVILIDFPDRPGTRTIDEVDAAFNGDNYSNARGSVRNWTEVISRGKVSVRHLIVGTYTVSQPTTAYLGENYTAASLRDEALKWLDDQGFDYSQLSTDSSQRTASVFLWYEGKTVGTWGNSLWPHAGGANFKADGVTVASYAMSSMGTGNLNIGTVRHELGHSVFKWPDTYDYDYDSKGNGGFTQDTDLCNAVFRAKAGWIDVIEISGVPSDTLYSLPDDGSTCLRYSRPGTSAEYFLIEYYRKIGWRSGVPDQGLLVWHVEESGSNSWQEMLPDHHYKMSVEQADGLFELEFNTKTGGAGDLFRAGYRDTFSDDTYPTAQWWDRSPSGLVLHDIGEVTPDFITLRVSSPRLVGHYPANEGAGTKVYDQTAQNNHGAITGGAAWVSGLLESVLALDGINDFMRIESDPAQALGDRFALAAWVQPTEWRQGATLMAKGTDTSPYALQLTDTGTAQLTCIYRQGTGSRTSSTTNTWTSRGSLPLRQWTHVAVTYDGTDIRFYLNGNLDSTYASGPWALIELDEPLYLGAGFHDGAAFFVGQLSDIRLYAEGLSSNDIRTLARSHAPAAGLTAELYTSASLTESPALTLHHTELDFDWSTHPPDNVIPGIPYGIRWFAWLAPPATGLYTLISDADDGLQAWLDGVQIMNTIGSRGNKPTHQVTLDADRLYLLQIDYINNSGKGLAQFSWETPTQPAAIVPAESLLQTGLKAEYFNDQSLQTLKVVRTDPLVDADWGSSSPAPGVNKNFSARWSGRIVGRYSETYTFHVLSDNGCRLWVNGALIIDKWVNDSGREYTGTVGLTAGQAVDIQLEMFDASGAAECHLYWSSKNQPKEIVPTTVLQPVSISIMKTSVRG